MTPAQIKQHLGREKSNHVLDYTYPKPYVGNKQIKAILLGCDPSNRHHHDLEFTFAIHHPEKTFNRFVSGIDKQLQNIGLDLESVYAQNLCRNFFDEETNNNPIWAEVAELWIPFLKEELTQFGQEIPVLLSAEVLYKVLLSNGIKPAKAADFYNCRVPFTIPSEHNKLNRPLIPFYRHFYYNLAKDEWKQYRQGLANHFIK